MMLDLLVAVAVFLAAHVTITLHIASGKILADVIVLLDVLRSDIPVPVRIHLVKIWMRRGCIMRFRFADII
jgi:hypothetical protein